MREILFRGRMQGAPEWVFGCYYKQSEFYGDEMEDHIIITSCEDLLFDQALEFHAVNPKTVGQFTGLTDKNGKKIFEGDIVKDESGVVYPVEFGLTGFYLKYAPPHSHGFHYDLLPLSNYWHAHGAIIEVIGNIYDNPELLKGE